MRRYWLQSQDEGNAAVAQNSNGRFLSGFRRHADEDFRFWPLHARRLRGCGNARRLRFRGNVTVYMPNGKQTTPTITDGINDPLDVLVDKSGKISIRQRSCQAFLSS